MNRSRRAFSRLLSVFLAAATLAPVAPGAIQTRTIPLKPNEALLRVLPRVQGGSYAILGVTGIFISSRVATTLPFVRVGTLWYNTGLFNPFSSTSGAILGGGWGLQILRLDAMGREISRIAVGSSPGTALTDAFVDSDGSLVLLGNTSDRSVPTVNPLIPLTIPQDSEGSSYDSWAYLLRTDASGTNIANSTLIGGVAQSDPEGFQGTRAYSMARDSSGNIYIAGSTTHRDFPVTANAYKRDAGLDSPSKRTEGFLLKVDRNLSSLLYSTFLGSDETSTSLACPSGIDCGLFAIENTAVSVRVGAGQQPWVALTTNGVALPATEGAYVETPPAANPGGQIPAARLPIPETTSLLRLDASGAALLISANLGVSTPPLPGAPSLELLSDGSPVLLLNRSYIAAQRRLEALKLNPSATALLARYSFSLPPAELSLAAAAVAPDNSLWLTGRYFGDRSKLSGIDAIAPALDLGSDFVVQLAGSDLNPRRLWFLPDLLALPGLRATAYGVELASQRGIVTTIPSLGNLGPAILSIRNAATSLVESRISPYEFIRIDGVALDLPLTATPQFDRDGNLPDVLGGVRVTVDGMPSPLLSVSEDSVLFIAPETLAGKEEGSPVELVVEAGGQAISRYQLFTALANPKVFGVETGPLNREASALNQDGTLNSRENPAKLGESLAFFLNGLGAPNGALVPAGKRVEAATPWTALKPSVFGFGLPAFGTQSDVEWNVEYFGAAPGLAAGTQQMNVRIPPGLLSAQTPEGQGMEARVMFLFSDPQPNPAAGERIGHLYSDSVSIWIRR